MFTNINIYSTDNQYRYIFEYEANADYSLQNPWKYTRGIEGVVNDNLSNKDDISFWAGDVKWLKHYNNWDYITDKPRTDYIPTDVKTGKIKLYLPLHSLNTYYPYTLYMLDVSTFIHGHNIILGSFLVNIGESLACEQPVKFYNDWYYEYLEFEILDPTDIMYSDNWKEFRFKVCDEPAFDKSGINSEGSILNFSLHPVESVSTGWQKRHIGVGGQNSLNLFDTNKGKLNVHLSHNMGESFDHNCDPAFHINVTFNEYFEDDLIEYIKETYGITNFKICFDFIMRDDDDLYAYIRQIMEPNQLSLTITRDDIYKANNNFYGWEGYDHGIIAKAYFYLLYGEEYQYNLVFLSNILPITPDIYKYIVNKNLFQSNGRIINNVNLNDVDMNVLNINVVNKTEIINNTDNNNLSMISDRRPEVIQPVFYTTTNSELVNIHTNVNETICINLDRYKHLVKRFVLYMGGKYFNEVGRTKSGILFKITAGEITATDSSEKIYYILDQDKNLISRGKYNVIIA
jgi:hypothetical protein